MKKFKYRKSMEPFKKWLVPTIYEDVPTFLGIPLAKSKDELKGSDAVIIGVPYETTPTIAREPRNAALNPQNLRKASIKYSGYLPELDIDIFEHVRLVDYGDVQTVYGDIHESISRTEKVIEEALETGSMPILIGGTEPCICYSVAKALAKRGKVGIIAMDAHGDNLNEHLGEKWSGACWVARVSELKNVDMKKHFQVGMRGPRNLKEQVEWFKNKGSNLYTIREIRAKGIETVAKEIVNSIHDGNHKVFMNIDFDVLDIGCAQGLDEPLGLSVQELLTFAFEVGKGGLDCFAVGLIPSQSIQLHWIATWTILYLLAGMIDGKHI
ncbi:MAG: arginase family protein [Candidatus Bathyarchaeia archaeon]